MDNQSQSTRYRRGELRRTLQKWWNVITFRGWSFEITEHRSVRRIVHQGDIVTFATTVRNNGLRQGTIYVVAQLRSPYLPFTILFDSDRDSPFADRSHARLHQIPKGQVRSTTIRWTVPPDFALGIYDMRAQVWSPQHLYKPRRWRPLLTRGKRFSSSPWGGGLEVIESVHRSPLGVAEKGAQMRNPKTPRAFISYSWDDEEHTDWVVRLAEELVRQGVWVMLDRWHLHAGEEVLHFMERGCRDCDKIIIVCTPEYVEKANARKGGVGFETVVSASLYTEAEANKRRFVPVVRKKAPGRGSLLPSYLGSAKYIDMSCVDWRGTRFNELLRELYEVPEYQPPPLGSAPIFE